MSDFLIKNRFEQLVKTWGDLSDEQREKIVEKMRNVKLVSELPSAIAHAYKKVTGTTSIAAMQFERVMVDLLNQLKVQLKQEADEIVECARTMKVAIDGDDFEVLRNNLEYIEKILKSMNNYANFRQDSQGAFMAKMFERLRSKR
jgi:hypothetical protein